MSFERLAPGWYMGTPLLGAFPSSSELMRTVPKLFVQKICFTLKTCSPSGSLEFRHMPSADCPCDQLPIKSLGTESLTNFPAGNISHTLSRRITGGNPAHPVWPHWERALGCLHLVSLDFAPCSFSLCGLCFVSLCCNKSQHEYNYMLTPVSPLGKSSKLEVILGNPDIRPQT